MDRNNPLVTIGIPTHNRGRSFLTEALESALNQSYSNIEIIVADNCSTDDTERVVKSYRHPRLRYYRHDAAVKHNENADYCLREAHGEYFLLLHDDDIIDEDFVEVCVHAVSGKDIAFVRTGARIIDENGTVLRERENPHEASTLFQYLDAILKGGAVTFFCNTLYNIDRLREIGGFQSRSYAYQDVISNIKLACLYNRKDIREPKSSYRIHKSKLGFNAEIGKWCRDSLEIIDVMCEYMPEKNSYFRGDGTRIICRRNYNRAMRRRGIFRRLRLSWAVYRSFGFAYSPLPLFYARIVRKISRGICRFT